MLVTFPSLRHNTEPLQLERGEAYLGWFSEASVRGWQAQAQKQHSGRAGRREAAPVTAARKQKEKGEAEREPYSCRSHPSDPSPARPHLLPVHRALNSPLDEPTDEHSTP